MFNIFDSSSATSSVDTCARARFRQTANQWLGFLQYEQVDPIAGHTPLFHGCDESFPHLPHGLSCLY